MHHMSLLFVIRVSCEFDNAWLGCKNGVILSNPRIITGPKLDAALSDHNGTRLGFHAGIDLDAQSPTRRITAIVGGSSLFLGCHASDCWIIPCCCSSGSWMKSTRSESSTG
jgi:hypothetical protein